LFNIGSNAAAPGDGYMGHEPKTLEAVPRQTATAVHLAARAFMFPDSHAAIFSDPMSCIWAKSSSPDRTSGSDGPIWLALSHNKDA
jgi:hypothetical protein